MFIIAFRLCYLFQASTTTTFSWDLHNMMPLTTHCLSIPVFMAFAKMHSSPAILNPHLLSMKNPHIGNQVKHYLLLYTGRTRMNASNFSINAPYKSASYQYEETLLVDTSRWMLRCSLFPTSRVSSYWYKALLYGAFILLRPIKGNSTAIIFWLDA
jgi:hypothetical protein